MKFVFELEKILSHKRTVENVAARDWADAQALVDAEMKALDKMYDLVDDARQMSSQRETSGQARGFELGQIDSFIHGHKIRIEQQRKKIRGLMSNAEIKHEALILAARERKTFEKLKETRFEEFKLKRKKHELKEMDELVVTRFKTEDQKAD